MHPAPDLGPIPFDSVPTASKRHDGWTPARQRDFIDALGQCGLVGAAARAVGMTPKSAYRLRARAGAESFRAAWDAAVDRGGAVARDTAIERAFEGEKVPVFYRGVQVGERRRYDNSLLIAALRNWRPGQHDSAAALADFLGSSDSAADVP
ncbi:hypothetical protein [Sphingomonas sp.]|jgi:hypothetical protein|uniref:hypothetical protein n=1 Tax=Sphingomonas sp. TaxID=28214 RepID=UPI002E3260E9|nr:hypothetical protein [Sphingomonas sp.]HEX4693386.1 hypothetical protein [Sphingomonas sp.]